MVSKKKKKLTPVQQEYQELAKKREPSKLGAGTAVPVTGFANAMASAAIEYRREGLVLGLGGSIFKVAGPVIVFGSLAAFCVGIAYIIFDPNIVGG
ncbi:SpoVA/SpoVAEb family sporulation membrane protein [Paenibacillus sp. AR247]|uniref:SpoVA/SpoVAEb family sporulation membrane protein n=1 Tax=Paenibacillus sp. AR247 TaxID=1631599 RepID=UPI000CF89F2E|nr:SpoVA/SpoVAEb family sporulation membrane protein [Paenibacillus sp. AR247]PQP89739.1 hypothetical protein CPT76_17305 [Paenibacillus sp. AR247]